jgi:peroxiredoxin
VTQAWRSGVCLAGALLLAAVTWAQPRQLWFPTGTPELVQPSQPTAAGQPLLSRTEYEAFAKRVDGRGSLVRIVHYPNDLSPSAGFGYNFVFGGKNRCFAVDGSETTGYVLYADVNANGDLRDDEPIRLEHRDGYYTTLIKSTLVETGARETSRVPIEVRFLFVRIVTTSGSQLAWRTVSTMTRRGTITLGTGSIPFALFGTPGAYDKPDARLWVDLDGDGQGWSLPQTVERFLPVDRRIKIAGASYEFHIDPYGRSLALTPLDVQVPDRPSLAVGTPVPEFSFVDRQGKPVRLADYRGRVLLIDIWAAWCGPCREEAPRLADLYHKYQERGLVIIGISPDQPAELEAFVRQFGHTWPQIAEPFEGPAHRLFRVVGYPSHVLVDRDGRIALAQEGGLDVASYERHVERLIAQKTKRP